MTTSARPTRSRRSARLAATLAAGTALAALTPFALTLFARLAVAADAPASTGGPTVLRQHAQAVAEVVGGQMLRQPSAVERRTAATLEALLGERSRSRADLAGRERRPIDRRTAIAVGLQNNPGLAITRAEPARRDELLREVRAVFDPVFDFSIGYSRADTDNRNKFGTVFQRAFGPVLASTNGRQSIPPSEYTPEKPQVIALQFIPAQTAREIERDIPATNGREFGAPKEKVLYSVQLSQELPWGGRLTITDATTQEWVYYRRGYYHQDGQWTTNLTATLDTPLPGTRGFGDDNPSKTTVRRAEVSRARADWELRAAVNQLIFSIDNAYFELVRRLESLATTRANRDLLHRQRDRAQRRFAQEDITRYQVAQMESAAARGDVEVELALESYLVASTALAALIGDPDGTRGAALYIPYGYADSLNERLPVDADKALTVAQANRAEFQVAGLDVTLAGIGVDAARNQAKPDVRFAGSVALAQNGSIYGHADPFVSHANIAQPDRINQDYTVQYRYPWGNRAAKAAVEVAELATEDANLGARDTTTRIRREINERTATVQTARARIDLTAREIKDLERAYASLERRQEGMGDVSDDELILLLRRLLTARLDHIAARLDHKQAEAGLLAAQGIIANDLTVRTAGTKLEKRRLSLLAAGGKLRYFGPVN